MADVDARKGIGTGFRMCILHHSTHEGQGCVVQKESHAFMCIIESRKGFRQSIFHLVKLEGRLHVKHLKALGCYYKYKFRP